MVLHKELRVCNSNLPIILVEDNMELVRGTAKSLLEDCSKGVLPSDSFVGKVDIITKDNKDSVRFQNIEFNLSEFAIEEPHLVIKIKTRK